MTILCHYYLGINEQSNFSSSMGRGVDLFFVLSGFLISGLLFTELEQTRTIDAKRFWIRRGFKIYPPFYVFLILTSVFIFHGFSHEMWSEIFFFQNYGSPVWMHTWSLAVEEHFYFSLPLLLLVLIRFKHGLRAIPLISAAVSALCFYGRVRAYTHSQALESFVFPTHLRIDALFAGVALSYFAHFDEHSFREARKWWVLVLGLGLLALALVLPPLLQVSLSYIAFAFLLAWTVNRGVTNFYWWPLSWIGRYSYSIYLWHAVPMMFLVRMKPTFWRLPFYLLSSISIGIILSKLIELPALRLRDKLFPAMARVKSQAIGQSSEQRVPMVSVSAN